MGRLEIVPLRGSQGQKKGRILENPGSWPIFRLERIPAGSRSGLYGAPRVKQKGLTI